MNDMRGVRIVLDPHAIRVGDEETSVSARRIEETIGFVAYDPSYQGCDNVARRIVRPQLLFSLGVHSLGPAHAILLGRQALPRASL